METQMYGRLLALFLIAFAGLPVAAKPLPKSKPGRFVSLDSNAQWTYETLNGNERKEITFRTTNLESDGESVSVEVCRFFPDKRLYKDQVVWKATKEGLTRVDGSIHDMYPGILVLRLPPKVGDTWETEEIAGSLTIKSQHKVLRTEIVTSRAGRFDTYVVERKDSLGVCETIWLNDQIGTVRLELVTGGKRSAFELSNFSIVKPSKD